MGTNIAPVWATLLRRMCECDLVLPASVSLSRFTYNGILLHYVDLRFTFEVKNQPRCIPFMDLLIISLKPLQTSVYWNKSHSCSYIAWGSNIPKHMRTGWALGECISTYACVVMKNTTGCALRRYKEVYNARDTP